MFGSDCHANLRTGIVLTIFIKERIIFRQLLNKSLFTHEEIKSQNKPTNAFNTEAFIINILTN